MNISQNLEIILKNTNHTQKELSIAIGVATSTINNWIKLGRSIPAEHIIPICEFLNVSPYYLLTGSERETNEVLTIGNQSATITNSTNIEVNGIKQGNTINSQHMNDLSETAEELLRVFNNLPPKGKIRLMNMVYDYEEQYWNNTSD